MKLKPEYHFYMYLLGLAMLLVGLPLSKSLMSVAQFLLIGNWLWEGNIKKKLAAFRTNKTALLLSSIYLIHLIGLFYTADFSYAFKDLRIKIPLLLLPLICSTTPPLGKKWFFRLLHLYALGILIATVLGGLLYFGITGNPPDDPRKISFLTSHIRMSLMICLAMFIMLYYLFQKDGTSEITESKIYKIISITTLFWMAFFLMILESLTGLFILSVTIFLMLMYFAWNAKSRVIKALSVVAVIIMPFFLTVFLRPVVADFYQLPPMDPATLETHSAGGEKYHHDLNNQQVENGYYVWTHIAWKELENSWNKRSRFHFKGKDQANQQLDATLIRFLTSKGFKKDAEGVKQLTDEEIRAIERGRANVNFMNGNGIYTRMYAIAWEIHHYLVGGNPQGNSLAQRFEFWKAAIGIIQAHPYYGVGTGDVKQAFAKQYDLIDSPLAEEYRLRAHNQYLTMMVAFGVPGLALFLLALFYPLHMQKNRNFFFVVFLIIALLSFVNEDTLETQAGVTFYAFFSCFFLFALPANKRK